MDLLMKFTKRTKRHKRTQKQIKGTKYSLTFGKMCDEV